MPRLALWVVVALVAGGVFALHTRLILGHFSTDGYLQDSGWFAYLFASRDPLLHNPSSINGLSFYAHHLSPHLFVFGAPLALLGLSGVDIFAVHQGLFFALFFGSLFLIVHAGRLSWPWELVGVSSAILIGALSNALFQAANYPHYEIATLALASLALAAGMTGRPRLFAGALFWLLLIREDGGLYAAFVCLACVALGDWRIDRRAKILVAGAGAALALSGLGLFLKARLFPGFDTFGSNFSGHGWEHLTASFVGQRLRAMIENPNITPILLGSLLLSIFDRRYGVALLLLSPLYGLHLIAVREEHGHFTLYYVLPWLLPAVAWLVVFARRARAAAAARAEPVLLLALSLALAAPVQAAVGVPGDFWHVAHSALTRPVRDLDAMAELALRTRTQHAVSDQPDARHCVVRSVAALIPNHVAADEVLERTSDLSLCRTVMLMADDPPSRELRDRMPRRFKRVLRTDTAEVWARRRR